MTCPGFKRRDCQACPRNSNYCATTYADEYCWSRTLQQKRRPYNPYAYPHVLLLYNIIIIILAGSVHGYNYTRHYTTPTCTVLTELPSSQKTLSTSLCRKCFFLGSQISKAATRDLHRHVAVDPEHMHVNEWGNDGVRWHFFFGTILFLVPFFDVIWRKQQVQWRLCFWSAAYLLRIWQRRWSTWCDVWVGQRTIYWSQRVPQGCCLLVLVHRVPFSPSVSLLARFDSETLWDLLITALTDSDSKAFCKACSNWDQ